jgi:hypothetical protein
VPQRLRVPLMAALAPLQVGEHQTTNRRWAMPVVVSVSITA